MAKSKSGKLKIDLDHRTAILMGTLVTKGLIKLKHDDQLGHGQSRLEMTTDPNDKKVTLRTNLNLAQAYGFPIASE